MKFDRIIVLGLSGIFLVISIFTMNTALLILALLLFMASVFYNMKKNTQENRLFDYNSLSKGKKFLCESVIGIGAFGIIMAFIGLFLSL